MTSTSQFTVSRVAITVAPQVLTFVPSDFPVSRSPDFPIGTPCAPPLPLPGDPLSSQFGVGLTQTNIPTDSPRDIRINSLSYFISERISSEIGASMTQSEAFS
jgi:hypothetical protein